MGTGTRHLADLAPDLEWTGDEHTTVFEGEGLGIYGAFTSEEEATQPVSVGEDGLLWVWGSIFGTETPDGYRPRPSGTTTADYCAQLYERDGLEFVSTLNGDFVGVHFDRTDGTVSIFTDRLGLRDAYYVRPDDETLVFSTSIQSLSRHPRVTPAFDPDYVVEYFRCHYRTFGLKTPLADTYLFTPGAITSVDRTSLSVEANRYWTPRYRPLDRPFSYFLEEFTTRFRDGVRERIDPGRQYGLLLSGGADSRCVLAAVPPEARENLTAYHMAGWESREARTARRVAETAGVEFELLERDRDYHARALSRNPALSNYVGTFQQAHAEGFMDEIRGEVDEMMTASFADSNFNGYSFPQYAIRIDSIGTIELPFFEPMDSVDAYVDFWTSDLPAYLDTTVDLEAVFDREIRETDAGVEHHGVTYESPEDLFVSGLLTPRTNGSVLFLLQSLRQHCPAWSPFVDNRLVDLYLSMPKKFFARRNVITGAMEALDPELADIPYADTGLPIRYPFPAHLLGDLFFDFLDRHYPWNDPPEPHRTNDAWPDVPELIRTHSFVREALEAYEPTIRALPFLDWDGVLACYREHLDGADNHAELYGLLSFLAMPVTERIVAAADA